MNDNETVDDVLADMLLPRFDAITAMRANNYDEIKSLIANYRDRIEAAYKRELSKICPKTGGDFGQLGDVAKLREAISTLRTALKEIRNDVLDMVMNHKSKDPDSYAHGLCLSIGGACDMALNSTKGLYNGNE